MPVRWQQLYADRASGMRASDIREILKVTAQPDVISLAGGLPAPELFPIDEYRRAFEWVLETDGASALQYGPSEGYRPLRVMLAERLARFGIECTVVRILDPARAQFYAARGLRTVCPTSTAIDALTDAVRTCAVPEAEEVRI